MMKDIHPGGFTVFNGALYFAADDGVNGYELWKSDGTAAGTVMVKNINTAAGASSYPYDFTVLNGALYFQADDGVNGYELWQSDGTGANTQLLKDICPGVCDGFL
jgi:ELWxxDGT repeat protein